MPEGIQRIRVLGIPVDLVTVGSLHREILRVVQSGERARVLNVNVNAMNLAHERADFADCLKGAELVFCDGAGVILGARMLGEVIPERITYADWTWQLAEFAEQEALSLYLLGGRDGVAEAAAQRLLDRHPNLKIAGCAHGYFEKVAGSEGTSETVRAINAAAPDILLVAFGMPAQELWIDQEWASLNARIALAGGAVFDYVSGDLKRGPRWLTDHGFEWLARVLIEPRRLWKRYFLGLPPFFVRILVSRLRGGSRSG